MTSPPQVDDDTECGSCSSKESWRSWRSDNTYDPPTWCRLRKIYVVCCCILLSFNSTVGSSITAGAASQGSASHWNITNQLQLVMPTSLYLVGYILGPIVASPLSETFGRKPVIYCTHAIFTGATIGVALAPSWIIFNIMRLLCGCGSSMTIVGGIYADIYKTPKARGIVFMISLTCSVIGPIIGPIAGQQLARYSYRSAYWLPVTIAAVTWIPTFFMLETYGPVLRQRENAHMLNHKTEDTAIGSFRELEHKDVKQIITVVLLRPFKMLFTEAIVMASCLYMGLFYSLFYILLQALPIIYKDVRVMNGKESLALVAVAGGVLLADAVYLLWDRRYHKESARQPPPVWTLKEEYRRLPLACITGPLFIGSMFWLGWSAGRTHWIVPVLSGIPFGMAYLLMFMGMMNYLVDAYTTYSASALAAASCTRSILAVGLPFATPSIFSTLGIAWSCSLLGFVSLVIGVVPFVFIRYGDQLKAASKMCQAISRQNATRLS